MPCRHRQTGARSAGGANPQRSAAPNSPPLCHCDGDRRVAVRDRLCRSLAVDPLPRLIWNASASAPIGLYRVQPDSDPTVGALVAVTPSAPLARWLAMRRYLPEGVPLLKHVAAKPGARICRIGARVSIDTRPFVIARSHDRFGRSLPVWQGCRTLKAGELFLLNARHPDSLDGRYFGPLPAAVVLGRARSILTRESLEAPLV